MAILDALKKKDTDEEKKDSKKKSADQKEPKATEKKEIKKESNKEDSRVTIEGGHLEIHTILKRPHITEKAAILAERGVYTFLIHPGANKIIVAEAIKEIYDVDPVRVSIVNLPAKKVMTRGRRGTKSAKKKALVYLKKGDKIEFV